MRQLWFLKLVFLFLPSNHFRFPASPVKNTVRESRIQKLGLLEECNYQNTLKLPVRWIDCYGGFSVLQIIGFISSNSLAFCYCCALGLCRGCQNLMMWGRSFTVSRLSQSTESALLLEFKCYLNTLKWCLV